MATDFELLEAWANGEEKPARELFERYYRSLFRFFRAKVDHGVEDLVQDTLLGCVQGRDRIRSDSKFRGYLFGVAHNVLRQYFRKRRVRDARIDFGTQSAVDLGAGASSVLAKKAEHRLLLEALRRIPMEAQIVIELYEWEGLTGPELAEALDITEPAVRSRIHRARSRLKEQLEKLDASPQLLASTLSDLEGWAQGVRDVIGPAPP